MKVVFEILRKSESRRAVLLVYSHIDSTASWRQHKGEQHCCASMIAGLNPLLLRRRAWRTVMQGCHSLGREDAV